MGDELEHEVITSGPLYDAVQEAAVPKTEEENIIGEVFITDDDKVVSSNELIERVLRGTMWAFDLERIHKETNNSALLDVAKSIEGSTQSVEEVGRYESYSVAKVVEPPYPPELLAMFLEVDETHFR